MTATDDLNARLRKFYLSIWPSLIEELSAFGDSGLSWPHLITIQDSYLKTQHRTMIVGQQTHGWCQEFGRLSGNVPVDRIPRVYDDFFGGCKYGTPFFSAADKLQRLINAESDGRSFIWTNLVKIDQGRGRPRPGVEDAISSLCMLQEEIKITQPHVVVFLTGPSYDKRLGDTFPGLTFDAVDSMCLRVLARVRHEMLPVKSFRTYHPNYLQRSQQGPVVLQKIAQLATAQGGRSA